MNASTTTMENTINAFNQLNFNKFVENVVEEPEEGAMSNFGNPSDGGFIGDQTSIFGDMKSEDEKLREALDIALNEVNQARQDRKDDKAAQDDEGMEDGKAVLEGSSIPIDVSMELSKKIKAK